MCWRAHRLVLASRDLSNCLATGSTLRNTRGGAEWTAIARSDEAPVTREGRFMGTIAQPELRKRALTFTISYIFG